MNATEVEERVRKIIAEQLLVKPDVVTLDAKFIDDLGADSLDVIELGLTFEEEFDLELLDENFETIKTAREAVAYLVKELAQRS